VFLHTNLSNPTPLKDSGAGCNVKPMLRESGVAEL
jgi:hypothetical protein